MLHHSPSLHKSNPASLHRSIQPPLSIAPALHHSPSLQRIMAGVGSSAPSSHHSPAGVGSSGEPGGSRKRPRHTSPDPPAGGSRRTAGATCSKAVADYLGIAPGRPTDCLLQVKVIAGGEEPKPNKWLVVVAACHGLLGADCGVKVALDAEDDKCFVLCKEASHAERLAYEKAINVNDTYVVKFVQKHVLELYSEDADEVRAFDIHRTVRGSGVRELVGHRRVLP